MWLGSFVAEYSSGIIITSTVLCNLLADIPVQSSLWGYVVVLTRQTDTLGPLFCNKSGQLCLRELCINLNWYVYFFDGKESELARLRIQQQVENNNMNTLV